MSPHEVQVLIHHCTSSAPWPRGETSAYRDSVAWMTDEGLLRANDTGHVATDRGRALLRMICDTPLPVMTPIDPRTGQVIGVAP